MCLNFDNTLDIASILTLVTIGVIVFYSHKQFKQTQEQLKIQNEQLRKNFFADYTKRYQEIILHFPENINENNFNLQKLKKIDKETYDRTMRYMRVYFDLSAEEYSLNERGDLDEDVWNEWKAGMKVAFNKPAFKQAWKIVIEKSIFMGRFKEFVEKELMEEKELKKK